MAKGDAFDDPFDELAADAELESSFGAAREERRAEEEEYTKAAARQWARRRSILDVVRELQHRGDTVSLEVGELVFVGVIDAVGRDYLQLSTAGGRIDVALLQTDREQAPRPMLVRVIERAREGGRRTEPGAQTFRARLLEYDGDDVEAVVGSNAFRGEQLRGHLVVGRDHVVIRGRDGNEAYIPLASVSWVKPWRE